VEQAGQGRPRRVHAVQSFVDQAGQGRSERGVLCVADVQSFVDQAGQGRSERSVLRTRASEDTAPRRVHGALVLNPLRSEEEAFRFLLYAIAVIAVIIGVVLLLRAVL
jgi:hypothetical protein